jgi:nucleoside-diphosphate-sugar epimerase
MITIEIMIAVMKVLLTGPFGNVGESTLKALMDKGHHIRCFDIINSPHFPKNKKISRKYENHAEIMWGDLRNPSDVEKALDGQEAVIHLGAVISPLADKLPKLGAQVNVGGTANIVHSAEKMKNKPIFIHASSVAVYGDVRQKQPPLILTSDPLPEPIDEYSKQKIAAEKIVLNSKLNWTILRLSYVFSPNHLELDPLMFHVPLDTLMEPVHTRDVGLAMANSLTTESLRGETLNIAGGKPCRTNYREFLKRMMNVFGLGMLPDEAFSNGPFHMGYMDTEKSQNTLKYQRATLDDFLREAREKKKFLGFIGKITKPAKLADT